MYVTVFGQVITDLRELSCLLKDVGNAQILILWGVEDLDIVTFDAKRFLKLMSETYYLRLPETRSLRK